MKYMDVFYNYYIVLAFSFTTIFVMSAMNTITAEGSSGSSDSEQALMPIISTINVGGEPSAIVYNFFDGNMYVANRLLNSVSIIDSSTDSIVKNVSVGTNPTDIMFNHYLDSMYVVSRDSNRIDEFRYFDDIDSVYSKGNTSFNDPSSIAFNPSDNKIYVLSEKSNILSIMGASGFNIERNITGFDRPMSIAYNPDDGNMYVSNAGTYGQFITLINSSNYQTKNVTTGYLFEGMAYNPKNGYIYGAARGTTVAIDPQTGERTALIPHGIGPGIIFNPMDNNIYIIAWNSQTVSAIDSSSNQIIRNIRLHHSPVDIAYNPSNGKVYVANYDGTISAFKLKFN